MPIVSITRVRVRSWRFLPPFVLYTGRAARQAARAPGNLAVALLRDRRFAFWTATLWDSEVSMKQFMLSGVHRQAMPRLLHWCDEAALVHWTQAEPSLPSWPEAHTRLQNEGRPSKVNHPSAAHLADRFPRPIVSLSRAARLK